MGKWANPLCWWCPQLPHLETPKSPKQEVPSRLLSPRAEAVRSGLPYACGSHFFSLRLPKLTVACDAPIFVRHLILDIGSKSWLSGLERLQCKLVFIKRHL